MTNPFANRLNLETKKEPKHPIVRREEHPPTEVKKNELIEEVELYQDLNQKQIDKLNVWVARQDLGMSIAQGPLVCIETCAHAPVCPLFEDNLHPLGRRCPVEGSLMLRWKSKWATSLGMKLDQDNNDAFDLKLLDDLACLSMLKQRALNEMAIDSPQIAETLTAGYINEQPMEKIILNPRVQLIERLGKLELKIYSELLSTRKAKFQVAGRIDDMSRRQAEYTEKMRLVRGREIQKAETDETIDADYEVRD